MADLRTLLLPNSVIIDVTNTANGNHNGNATAHDNNNNNHDNIDDNPFAFLEATPLELPPMGVVDPFRNHTPRVEGVYEWCKTVLCLPIMVVRLVVFSIAIAIGYLATVVAMYGWKDRQSALPRWRCGVMWITRLCARLILFSFGYQWIKRIGKPAPRDVAPIVVSNHVTYIEPIYFFYDLFPTIVASESHDAIPFVGTIIRAMQVIYVDRFSPQSRKQAVNEIKRKASSNTFPRVMLFPEGTTSNGRFLLSFQLGAFISGYPVQPVVVRYPYIHFDQSWGNISVLQLMFRMFTQFHNFLEVEYLPVMYPPESKQQNVVLFAEKTNNAMAHSLNVLPTSYSYGDMVLSTRALEFGKENVSNYLVEMAWVARTFDISTSEAAAFLDQFLTMNPDSRGRVQINDFFITFGLGTSPLGEKIFNYLDLEGMGSITFRQFLTGSAHIRRLPLFQTACETAFARCCGDSTGFLSVNQIEEILKPVVPVSVVEIVFGLFDIDNDGLISRDDFLECLRKNPLLIAIFASYTTENNMETGTL